MTRNTKKATASSKQIAEEPGLKRDQLPLMITSEDLAADIRNSLIVSRSGGRLLGGADSIRAIYDEIPGAIARRLERIVPDNFSISKITIKMQLDVNVPGLKVGGTIDVTLEPKKSG